MLCSGQGSSSSRSKNDGDSRILVGNKRNWWRHSTFGGRLPSTLGGPACHIFVILLACWSGWTSAPLCKAYGAGTRRLLSYTLLRSLHARFVCGWRLHPRVTPTPHPLRPDVPKALLVRPFVVRMGIGPALVGLRGRTATAVYTRCCVRRARDSTARPGLMAGRPAGELW